jgi:hypothetical protein
MNEQEATDIGNPCGARTPRIESSLVIAAVVLERRQPGEVALNLRRLTGLGQQVRHAVPHRARGGLLAPIAASQEHLGGSLSPV